MPGKGHRAASRQAQLSRKRKGRPTQQPAKPQPPSTAEAQPDTAELPPQAKAATPAPTISKETPQPAVAPRPRERATLDVNYRYLMKDLRQIALLTAISVIVLIVLGFVLR